MEGMTKGKAFRRFPGAEWFAEVYKDVELDKDRWHFKPGAADVPEPVDRIVIGASLWVRTASLLQRALEAPGSALIEKDTGAAEKYSNLSVQHRPHTTYADPDLR